MTMMIDDLTPEVERAARSAGRSWTGALDVEDIAGDMWVKILESPKTLPSLLSYESDQRARVLLAIGRQCAQSELTDREVFSANVQYSTDDVRRILDNGGAHPEWAGIEPGSVSHTEWMDVQAGLTALGNRYSPDGRGGPWYAEVLFAHYVAGDYVEAPGDKGATLTRARDALTVEMNRARRETEAAHEGPGSRKAISNATARHQTED